MSNGRTSNKKYGQPKFLDGQGLPIVSRCQCPKDVLEVMGIRDVGPVRELRVHVLKADSSAGHREKGVSLIDSSQEAFRRRLGSTGKAKEGVRRYLQVALRNNEASREIWREITGLHL